MTKNTPGVLEPERDTREESEKDYVAAVAQIWVELSRGETQPKGSDLTKAIARKLKISESAASGLMVGFQTLLSKWQQCGHLFP